MLKGTQFEIKQIRNGVLIVTIYFMLEKALQGGVALLNDSF